MSTDGLLCIEVAQAANILALGLVTLGCDEKVLQYWSLC